MISTKTLPALARPSAAGGALLAICLSLLFAAWLYPDGFLSGQSAFWLRQNADITQYQAGFHAFIHEPWHWPLFRIESVNWPNGTLITFVDGIPLYAALLKLLRHGPDTPYWNPYGGWVVLCYAMQGLGAWWVCREARLRSWTALAVLAVLLASFPVFSYRVNHLSLMSQWLLVFGLACYLRGTRQGAQAWKAWAVLLVCAFYINIYLFSMLSGLFFADLARFARSAGWRGSARAVLASYGVLGLSLFVTMLPLPGAAGSSEGGFGIYSMNLLAPLAGGRLLDFGAAMASPGQGEGYNYAGVFVLAMFALALVLRRRAGAGFLPRHGALAAVLLLATLYALSNQVYAGQAHLLDLRMPSWTFIITGQLRASGRFYWLVGYAMVVVTVIMLARHGGRAGAPLLALLAVLQLWDLAPSHAERRRQAGEGGPTMVQAAAWDNFFGAEATTLYFFPAFQCGKSPSDATLMPTMLYAAERGLRMSTGYVARAKSPCSVYDAVFRRAAGLGAVFVLARDDYPTIDSAVDFLGGPAVAHCITADYAHLCKRPPGPARLAP